MSTSTQEPNFLDGKDTVSAEAIQRQGFAKSVGIEPIYLTVPGNNGLLYHSVITLPGSYQAAKETAIQRLGKHLSRTATADRLELFYGFKREGKTAWASMDPHYWCDLMRGGEELRIVESNGANNGDFSTTHAASAPLIQTVTMRCGRGPDPQNYIPDSRRYVTVEMPNTELEAKNLAIANLAEFIMFRNYWDPENIKLTALGLVKNSAGEWKNMIIPGANWKAIVVAHKAANPDFELIVEAV